MGWSLFQIRTTPLFLVLPVGIDDPNAHQNLQLCCKVSTCGFCRASERARAEEKCLTGLSPAGGRPHAARAQQPCGAAMLFHAGTTTASTFFLLCAQITSEKSTTASSWAWASRYFFFANVPRISLRGRELKSTQL